MIRWFDKFHLCSYFCVPQNTTQLAKHRPGICVKPQPRSQGLLSSREDPGNEVG